MQKRRERIERWRAERKKKEQEAIKKEGPKVTTNNVPQGTVKKWSLEDDSEDEDKVTEKPEKEEETESKEKIETKPEAEKEKVEEDIKEDEIDTLDAFMMGLY